jgi:hypothetical protein
MPPAPKPVLNEMEVDGVVYRVAISLCPGEHFGQDLVRRPRARFPLTMRWGSLAKLISLYTYPPTGGKRGTVRQQPDLVRGIFRGSLEDPKQQEPRVFDKRQVQELFGATQQR